MATVTYIAQRRANLFKDLAEVTGINVAKINIIKDPTYRELELLDAFLAWATEQVGGKPAPEPEPAPVSAKKKPGRPKKTAVKE